MPEVDVVLVHTPAKINFLAAKERREIDQADVEVLHQNAQLFDALEGGLQRLGVGIALRLPGFGGGGIHLHAAAHQNALHKFLDGFFGFRVMRFGLYRFADAAADHRQSGARFREREVAGH